MGRRHAVLLQAHPEFELSVAADVVPDQLFPLIDQGFDRVTDDVSQALDQEGLEAVVIATPPDTHRALVEAALSRGLHVLVEKPLAHNQPDAEAICEAADRARSSVTVAFSARHDIALQRLREHVRSGALGRLLRLTISGRVDREPASGGWLFDTARGGGVVMESLMHALDLTHWIADVALESVFADAEIRFVQGRRYEHAVVVLGRLEGGAILQLDASFGRPPPRPLRARLDVIGEAGEARYDLSRQPLEFEAGVSHTSLRPDLIRHDSEVGALVRQLTHWQKTIRGAAEPASHAGDGLRALCWAMGILRSIREGTPTALGHE